MSDLSKLTIAITALNNEFDDPHTRAARIEILEIIATMQCNKSINRSEGNLSRSNIELGEKVLEMSEIIGEKES